MSISIDAVKKYSIDELKLFVDDVSRLADSELYRKKKESYNVVVFLYNKYFFKVKSNSGRCGEFLKQFGQHHVGTYDRNIATNVIYDDLKWVYQNKYGRK